MVKIELIYCISFAFCLSFSLPASSWEYRKQNQYTIKPFSPVELSNGEIVVGFSEHSFNDDSTFNFKLLRISSEGKYISEFDVGGYFNAMPAIATSIQIIDQQLIVGCGVFDHSIQHPALIKFDNNLNVLWDTIYTSLNNVQFSQLNQDTVHHRIWTRGISGALPVVFENFIELNTDYSLKSMFPSSFPPYNACVPLPSQTYIFSSEHTILRVYDSTFFRIKEHEFHNGTYYYSPPVPYDDHDMLYPCKRREIRSWNPFEMDVDLHLIRVNSNLTVVDSLMRSIPGSNESPAIGRSVVFSNGSYFLGGTSNIDVNTDLKLDTKKRGFSLLKLNKNLDVIWDKTYRSDGSYLLYSILATRDGGILMVGQCYPWLTDSSRKEMNLYILKVDQEGISVGDKEESISSYPTLKIFPNPSSQSFRLVLPEDNISGYLTILDAAGREVQHVSGIEKSSEVDISKLHPGVYTVLFKAENYSGNARLVKER